MPPTALIYRPRSKDPKEHLQACFRCEKARNRSGYSFVLGTYSCAKRS
jgi:hypothetical protein